MLRSERSLFRIGMLLALGVALGVGVTLVRPVRADAPAGRYVVSSGTVYDTKTKLTWQQVVPSSSFVLADAKAYCASDAVKTALGGSGWRLPTIRELYTLVDSAQSTTPKIDPVFAQDVAGNIFWSSTQPAGSTFAYTVGFNTGVVPDYGDAIYNAYARCVR